MESTLKIKVDAALCELHGQCAFVAPELFRIEGENLIVEEERARESERESSKGSQSLPTTGDQDFGQLSRPSAYSSDRHSPSCLSPEQE